MASKKPLTVSAAVFRQFYADPEFWPEDQGETYHDDVRFLVNGEYVEDLDPNALSPTDQVTIDYGGFVEGAGKGVSLDAYLRKWLNKQDTAYLTVSCPKDRLEAVKAAILEAGGKFS